MPPTSLTAAGPLVRPVDSIDVRAGSRRADDLGAATALRWPSETVLCICLGALIAGDIVLGESLIRIGAVVVNPLLNIVRSQGGWGVAALIKVSMPVVLYACHAFIVRHGGRASVAVALLLRVLVIEYAVVVTLLAGQLVRALLR